MAEIRYKVSIREKILGDADFKDRVRGQFLGDFRESLSVEIYDLSTQDEAEALALVLEIPKASGQDRPVFRVDRQGLLDLADAFYELFGGEKSG